MNQSRRSFIKKSALAMASVSLANQLFALSKENISLGIQLYTVRDEMKSNPLETLKQIASIGYKNVEHANYVNRKFYGYSANEFKKVLNDLGLKMPSGHTVMRKEHWDESKKDFTDAWKQTVEDAAIVEQHYVISPSLDSSVYQTEDSLRRFMEVFNKSGELCKKHGMKFGYHNHHFEFSKKFGDKTLYDVIMENTDQKLVSQQFDTGNLFNADVTALDIIKKYPNRFETMHVKDEIESKGGHEKYESCVLGKGIAETKAVIDLGKANGTTLFIVEQEAYQDKTPMASSKEDFEIMKSWGY